MSKRSIYKVTFLTKEVSEYSCLVEAYDEQDACDLAESGKGYDIEETSIEFENFDFKCEKIEIEDDKD